MHLYIHSYIYTYIDDTYIGDTFIEGKAHNYKLFYPQGKKTLYRSLAISFPGGLYPPQASPLILFTWETYSLKRFVWKRGSCPTFCLSVLFQQAERWLQQGGVQVFYIRRSVLSPRAWGIWLIYSSVCGCFTLFPSSFLPASPFLHCLVFSRGVSYLSTDRKESSDPRQIFLLLCLSQL